MGAAVAALAFRLWNLRSAPFILDEPVFLGAARDQLQSGDWIAASPIPGTQGIRYGPTVFWFYSALQWVLGSSPLVAIAAMCVLITITQVLLARGTALLFGGGVPAFLLFTGLVVSSPYLHFWSRLAWDQSVLICVAATVAILCGPATLHIRHAVGAGVLIGLALSSHLMVLPFAASVLAVLAWELRADVAHLIRIVGTLVATVLLVNLPYLWFLATHSTSPSQASPDPSSFLTNLTETPAISTSFGIEYFFDAEWSDFVDWIGAAAPALHLRPLLLVAVTLLAALGLVAAWSGEDVRERRVARVALATWVGSAALFAVQGVDQHPHYQFATWWVVPVGLLSALGLVRSGASQLRPVMVVATGVVVLQLGFVVAWTGYVEERSGTRGIHQGAPVGTQIDAVRAICATPSTAVAVANETAVFAESLRYLVATTPACDGKRVDLCGAAGCGAQPGTARLRLVYRDREGAALAVRAVDQATDPTEASSG